MADEFARAIARAMSAQLAQATGFDGAQESALDLLGELALRYAGEVGAGARGYAELAGRSSVTFSDVVLALGDIGVTVPDLQTFRDGAEEEIFAHDVPPFPIERQKAAAPSFSQRGEEPPAHVPPFLPAFPDKHTYTATPAFAGNPRDARQQRVDASKARRQAEKALVKLNERLEASAPRPAAATNPFLAPPEEEDDGGSALSAGTSVLEDGAALAAGTSAAVAAGPSCGGAAEPSADRNAGGAEPSGGWEEHQEVDGAALPVRPAVAFLLDWAGGPQLTAPLDAFREPEDGYRQEEADAEAPAAASAGAGRKRKASRLGLKPAHFRAQQILEGGTRGLRPDGPGDDGGGGGLPRG